MLIKKASGAKINVAAAMEFQMLFLQQVHFILLSCPGCLETGFRGKIIVGTVSWSAGLNLWS